MLNNIDSEISGMLKALGNPIRLDIIRYLSTGEKCVCHIFERLNLPQNLVSHHLGALRKQNIIIARKDGKWVHYSINIKTLGSIEKFIKNLSSN